MNLKNELVVFCIAVALPIGSYAQGVTSIFSQKASQEQLYLQQIAAYEVYLKDLQSGYRTLNNGLTDIHSLKQGEVNLHKDYFNSLSSVNPAIKQNPKVAAVLQFQSDIINTFSKGIDNARSSGMFTSDELTYIQKVYNSLLEKASNQLDELNIVITPGKAQMTDDQRIKKIDAIYSDMQDKRAFAFSFTGDLKVMAQQRQQAQKDINIPKSLYHLN